MGKIIAVVSGKGGTGKTSFTANTGLALASLGQRVLCMDCDITLRNLDLALGLSDRALMDFSDVLAQRCTLEQAVVTHRQYPTLDLLTAPMADKPLPLTVRQLAALAKEIRERYDWCLMDAPPDWDRASRWPPAWPIRSSWSPPPTSPPCGTPSAPPWSYPPSPSTRCIWWWAASPANAADAAYHHRRRHRYRRAAPAGRCPGGRGRPLLPQSRAGAAGTQLLRRPRLRKHRQTHHGPQDAPDEDITEKGAPPYEYRFDGARQQKELMVQFCTAYCGILAKHTLCATARTGQQIADATGLTIHRFLSFSHGGGQQIAARIAYNEIDMVLCFSDPNQKTVDEDITYISRLCDKNNIPFASNLATAEMLVLGLDQGYLDWRDIVNPKSKPFTA